MTVRSAIKNGFRYIPLVGGLVDVRIKDHTQAFVEVGLNILLSTVPIWFGAFLMLTGKNVQNTWARLMFDNVQSGELCLYATALLAPLYYFMFLDYRPHRFPSGRTFMLVSAGVLLLSGGLFAVERAESIFGQMHVVDQQFIFAISSWVYVVAIVTVYLAHVYKNFLETGAASLTSTDTQDFVADFISRPKE